ncbi:MAG: peptide-binding protein [Alphaproteobacteria bacterium]|nr:peptide-binding protein [Alphaproteobacteria bacterium]
MKRFIALFALLSCFVTHADPALAQNQRAFVHTIVNLRAGPGMRYPTLTQIHPGEIVQLLGCIEGRSWCEVETTGTRGFMSGAFLSITDTSGLTDDQAMLVPVVSFNQKEYWQEHYSDRPFYRQSQPRYKSRR